MGELGDMLRQAREKRGLSVAQVAVETHIRGKVLIALESGDYTQLPPEPFIRGLIRNYARFLTLDPDILLDAFAIETGAKPAPPLPSIMPESETAPLNSIPIEQINERRPTPIFVLPPGATNGAHSNGSERQETLRDLPPFLSPPPDPKTQSGFQTGTDFSLSPQPYSTASQGVSVRESPLLFRDGSKPVFQVADEVPSDFAPEESSSSVETPIKPEWIRRLSATSLPELVAVITLGLAVLVVGAFGYTRFFGSNPQIAQIEAAATSLSTATPQHLQTALPTPVPTFLASPLLAAGTLTAATKSVEHKIQNTLVPFSGEIQLAVEITAEDSPLWAWVVVDNVEVFKGNLQNDTRSWSAHSRLYVQVKDISNGSLSFNGKSILPRVFAERKLLERAWEADSSGTPTAIEAVPFATTSSQAGQVPATATPVTTTDNPPSSPIPNKSAAPSQILSPSPTATSTGPVGSVLNTKRLTTGDE